MQQKKLIYIAIVTCLLSIYPLRLYGMNISNDLRSFPKDIQDLILFSQDFSFLRDIIPFLGFQPITLTGPQKHTSSIMSVELYGDIIQTNSIHSDKEWLIILWNIHTGEYIHSNIEPYKAWEKEGAAIIIGNKAINIEYAYKPSDTFIPELIYKQKRTILWDIDTKKQLVSIKHEDNIVSMAAYENSIAMIMDDGKIKIWNIYQQEDPCVIEPDGWPTSIALNKDLIIIGLNRGGIYYLNRNLLKDDLPFFMRARNKNSITTLRIHNDTLLAGSCDGSVGIFDINTQNLLQTLNGPNGHTAQINALATNDAKVITGAQDGTIKIWPLIFDIQGTPEDNPLLWIRDKTDITQLNFIKRAYDATINNQEFIIDLPESLGKIEKNESEEQYDGRIYFTLPLYIREYLRSRLKIRRCARTTTEKIHLAYTEIVMQLEKMRF